MPKTLRSPLAGLILAALLLAPARAQAFGDTSRLVVAQLRYEGGNWNPRPNCVRRLAQEVMKRTSIEMALTTKEVTLDDDELFFYPLLYVAGAGAFADWNDEQIKRLRRYVVNGGLVVFDDAGSGDGFAESVRGQVTRMFPDRQLAPIDPEHVLYKSFYLVERQGGRVIKRSYMEGLAIDTRTAIVLSHNDLGGAWARDGFGNWEYEVVPGGRAQREMTLRLGINIMMYALCLDYKEDQVHVPFILKRRR